MQRFVIGGNQIVSRLAAALVAAAMLCGGCGGAGGGASGAASGSTSPTTPAVANLGTYQVASNTVTVAGISSGGAMAVQLQVANSASFYGAAVIAGAPYYCMQDDSAHWVNACNTGVTRSTSTPVPLSALVSYVNQQAAAGNIDPVANIGAKPIYMFSGTEDTVVYQAVMNDLQQFYLNFTDAGNIAYDNTTPAEHGWISPDGANPCDVHALPYINNCGIDPEQTFLTMFYGPLSSRNAKPEGQYIQFDQDTFCPGGSCAAISMDSTGWLYAPTNCAASECKLVVALHGCNQYQAAVGLAFVQNAGINEWADNNNILVLYPQTIASTPLSNSEGCWDWWGYTGANYALKSAPQMTAIMNMVHQITGGVDRHCRRGRKRCERPGIIVVYALEFPAARRSFKPVLWCSCIPVTLDFTRPTVIATLRTSCQMSTNMRAVIHLQK